MPDIPDELENGLERALKTMEQLQSRLESGEIVDEKELTMLSRLVATQIESVRAQLEAAVGPMDQDMIREEMRKQLSPEEFEEWLAGEQERKEFRDQLQREQSISQQLGDPEV